MLVVTHNNAYETKKTVKRVKKTRIHKYTFKMYNVGKHTRIHSRFLCSPFLGLLLSTKNFAITTTNDSVVCSNIFGSELEHGSYTLMHIHRNAPNELSRNQMSYIILTYTARYIYILIENDRARENLSVYLCASEQAEHNGQQ